MTASAQLSSRPLAGSENAASRGVKPARPVALVRSLPAPPAPVPSIAAPVQDPQLPPAAQATEVMSPPARRPGRVAGWVVAAATVALVVVAGLGWSGPGASPEIPAQTTVTRVGAGETVWDVAQRVAPQSDQRAVVDRIRQLNGIVGSSVQPGQQLEVPDGR